MTTTPQVSVEQGQLQGRVITNPTGRPYCSFQGVPYATPPVGPLRFKDPQPPGKWTDIRDATAEGNTSPHSRLDYFGNREYLGDEDCLYLNVYTPNLEGATLPVMVFIRGDNFQFGSGNTDLYGPDYLVEKDVVIVTLNYRSGVLGFLSLNTPEVPGNAGMKDIVAAIRWVKSNIKNFGGDPDNVTIFGEGAGGAAVSYLTVSPLTKKSINKVIIQSGTAMNFWAVQKNPEETAERLAKHLGCKSIDPEEILTFLRASSATDLVKGCDELSTNDNFHNNFNPFVPVIEQQFPGVEAFIIEPFSDLLRSGRVADIPVMIGTCTLEFYSDKKSEDLQVFIPEELQIAKNSKESLLIAEKLRQLYIKANGSDQELVNGYFQLASDRAVKIDTIKYIQYLAELEKQPIYFYNFDYVGGLNIPHKSDGLDVKSAIHMDELGYLFRNNFQKDVVHTHRDIEMRERMLRLWTNFAKNGNPTPEIDFYLTVTWTPVTKSKLIYLNLASELSLNSDVNKERMAFWNDLYIKDKRTKMVNNITPAVAAKADEIVEDDLPKNIGVNRFVNYFESLKK